MAAQGEPRILGMSAVRAARADVVDWEAPTRAEVDAMPLPPAYPGPVWNLAASLLAARSTPERPRLGPRAQERAAGGSGAAPLQQGPGPEAALATARPERARPEKAGVERPGDGTSAQKAAGEAAGPAPAQGERDPVAGPPPRVGGREPTAREGIVRDVLSLVHERPEDAAKVIRTMMVEESIEGAREADAGAEPELPVMQKVSIVLVALGQEPTGEIMKYLSDYEIEAVAQAVASLKAVSIEMQDKVLHEFRTHLLAGEWIGQGGMDFARGALERAVGPRKAQEILDRVASTVSSGFYMLKNVTPEQVAPFVSHEHPQTIALILSQLDPAQSAGILAQLPERMQADVAYRIATMENVTPAVLKEIEEALEASLRDILGGNRDVGGPKVVADILNLTGSSVEKSVLDQLDGQDPEVAEAVRNLMFTFADIAKLTDRELQVLLREVDQKDLVVALKAAEEELKTKILRNLSEETRKTISEEMEFLGPMRLSEVEEVQLRIVQQVRQLEERGQITIVRGDADDTWV